jgi:WD40 repeat protein
MTRRTILVCLLAAGILAPVLVRAEHTRGWRQTDFTEFERGTAKGVAIRSDGKLMPAPRFVSFADPDLAYLWQLRFDSHGRLYAAGGPDAKVLRFDEAGKPATVFESSELAAQSIVLDSKDNLFVGTSPDGKVYKVTPDGQKSVFFEPKTKYIWALALDSQGTLFVATGDKGEVFAVGPDGKGQSFYSSEERHARSLAFDAKGNLLVGTEPDGLIVRVDVVRKAGQPTPSAGATFVIYETDKKEVTSLLEDANGNVFASSIGDKPRAQGGPQPGQNLNPMPPQISINPQILSVTQTPNAVVQPLGQYPFITASGGGGATIVKIAPDGSPETLWNSREDLVFAMGLSAGGKVLLGTGDKGEVIELESDTVYSSVAKTASAQVTSFVTGPGGKLFVATANPGKIFELGPGFEPNGSFESDTFDARIFSHWGRLTWWGENGATTGKVAFYVRSGNTSSPEKNWSAWAGPYKNAAGESVSCPPARFAQWKAVFLDTDNGGAPSISWVNLAYQPKNVAPVIDDVALQDPGIRVQGFPGQPGGPGNAQPVQLRMPQHAGAGPGFQATGVMITDNSIKAPKIEVPPQGFEERGYQSVLWSAHDDNDDDLAFTIYYRGEGEKNWRVLKDKVAQKFYSWDTTSMPDGAYELKIAASDSPSNPPAEALGTERESDRFVIANTPPAIGPLQTKPLDGGSGVIVGFEATSASGSIADAEYSVDAGDWQVVFPDGLLSDAPKEKYSFQVSGLLEGEHTIAVRIADQFENVAVSKITFRTHAQPTK